MYNKRMTFLYLIIGLLLFVALVVLHELGHALAARRNGVRVDEFGIGFPPKLWSKRLKNDMELSLNALPIGGFVRLHGEHDSAKGEGTYGAASLAAKVQILLAGVVVNWLIAVVIFTILAVVGMPQVLPDQFTVANDTTYSKREVVAAQVAQDSPAAKAGIRTNDYILMIGGQTVQTGGDVVRLSADYAGQTLPVTIKRAGQIQTIQVTFNRERVDGQGYAGVAAAEEVLRRSTWSAPIAGLGVTTQFTWMTIKGLGQTVVQLFRGEFQQAGQSVAGPVGIFTILQHSSEAGLVPVLFLIAIISLTLSVMNILPIPALDGGRLFVTLLFRAIRKPLTKRREESIQTAGFLALMALIVLITAVDVGRLINK